jgi:uncharacterized OB-fold protein
MAEHLAPILNALSQPFWDAAAVGRLCLPFCTATGRAFWPPSPSSPFATGGEVMWHDIPPEGIVRSLVVYRRAFQQALADRLPYGVALVEVAPGVRLLAHAPDPGGAVAGDRVRLGFRPLREGELPVLALESRL